MQRDCTTANRFSSNYIYADIAQSVVHRIRNPKVASSILAISSIKKQQAIPSGIACFCVINLSTQTVQIYHYVMP